MTERYTFQGFYIRPDMVESLERYVEGGVPPGGFLQAVLCNDLAEACSRADLENLRNIPAFAAYLHNRVPWGAWGDYKRFEAWCVQGGKKGRDRKEKAE